MLHKTERAFLICILDTVERKSELLLQIIMNNSYIGMEQLALCTAGRRLIFTFVLTQQILLHYNWFLKAAGRQVRNQFVQSKLHW